MLVVWLCPTLCDTMDHSPQSFSVHGILLARILERVAIPSPGDLLNPGLNPGLLHCRQILYCLSHNGSPLSLAHHLYTPTPRHPYLGKSLSLPGVCFSPCNWGEHPPPLPMSEGLHWEGSGIIDNIVFLQFPVIFNFSKMNTCYLNYKNCSKGYF